MVYIKEKDSPRLPNQAVISPSINCATQLNRIVSDTQPSYKSYAMTSDFLASPVTSRKATNTQLLFYRNNLMTE